MDSYDEGGNREELLKWQERCSRHEQLDFTWYLQESYASHTRISSVSSSSRSKSIPSRPRMSIDSSESRGLQRNIPLKMGRL